MGPSRRIFGAALPKRGAAVFDELHEGVKDIEFLTDPTAGEVRIGCNPVLATNFVSTVVDRLSRRYPRIMFHVVVTPTEGLPRALPSAMSNY
jgi:DNA-binding transcriptional LysR family regulator